MQSCFAPIPRSDLDKLVHLVSRSTGDTYDEQIIAGLKVQYSKIKLEEFDRELRLKLPKMSETQRPPIFKTITLLARIEHEKQYQEFEEIYPQIKSKP